MKPCGTCGEAVRTVERVTGNAVDIDAEPSAEGDLMRLASGRAAGKFVKVSGPLLDMARADPAVQTWKEHDCG